jgi:hypothetical protein
MSPARFLSGRRHSVPCRWCGARVRIPAWFSVLRSVLVIGFATAGGVVLTSRAMDSGDSLDYAAAVSFVAIVVLLGWLAEGLAPLETIVPRGVAPWRRRRGAPNTESSPTGRERP